MNDIAREREARSGTALVALQLALMAWFAWAGVAAFAAGQAPAGAWALVAGGVLLGAWALKANPPGNFNIRPVPREGGRLVEDGPYRWVRHPMYTCVIMLAVATAWAVATPGDAVAAVALVVVLWLKAGVEERLMTQRHPGYEDYRRRTWRFVPGIV